MKKFTTVFLLWITYLLCFGQVDTTVVPFVSYWSIGDTYNFKVTKIKEQWKEGVRATKDSSSYVTKFEVIDSTETSYKIRWSYETNLREFNVPDKMLNKFSHYKFTEVIYETTEVGEFIGIENWKEIAEMMKSLTAEVVEYFAGLEGDMDKKDLAQSMKSLLGVYESKEGIEQLVFKELYFLHFPFGLEYNVDQPITYEELLPNMFGGKPIRGETKLYFESVDFEKSHCVMIKEMVLNPEDTKNIVMTVFKKMGMKSKEMKKAMKTAVFDIRDYNRMEYLYYPGIPIKIECKRESIMDIDKENGIRIDKTVIEWVD